VSGARPSAALPRKPIPTASAEQNSSAQPNQE
jgi:hypothetical protein